MSDQKKESLFNDYLLLRRAEQAALPGNVPFAVYETAADARLAGYWQCIAAGWTHEEIAVRVREEPRNE